MPITHGIKRVSIYDPTDGTTVQVSDVAAQEAEFDQRETESAEDVDATGGRYYPGDYSRLRFRGRESGALYDQLATWRAADTRLSAVLEGSSLGVLWTETDRLSVLRWVPVRGQSQGRADFFEVEMVRDGHGEHDIYRAVNLLYHLAAASGTSYSKSIVFPVAGAVVTAAITDTAASGTLTVTAKDYGGSTLTSDSTATANGRASVSLTLPSSVYEVLVTVTGGTSLSNASLRLDGESTYTAY